MPIEIKLVESSELTQLDETFRNPSPEENRARYEKQEKGEAAYIVAKNQGRIIGKVYLKFFGSLNKEVIEKVPDCPDMENLAVIESERGKGIGTQMISFVENLCREKGYKRVGLGVALDNKRARKLYERLGYHQTIEPFTISFSWKNENGCVVQLTEEVAYLTKNLIK